jgi:hypothetical protein
MVTFLIIKPYWVYSKKLNKNIFLLEEKILKKIDKLICGFFNLNDFEEFKISKIEYNEIDKNFLTEDKRHFVSDQISFEKFNKMCEDL